MSLLIQNGRIITAADDYDADIYCQDETISRIEPTIDPQTLPTSAEDLEIVDASRKYVFPGFIDPHVHIHLPFMGTHAVDDYESASKAALAGGTTTLIEMICPGPTDGPFEAFETWHSKANGLAAVDYTFHMSVVRFEEGVRDQFRRIVESGVPSFKVFLAYKGALDLSDEHLFAMMKMAKEMGVIVTAHCENAEAVDALQKALLAEGKTGTEWHGPSRPPVVEAEGVHQASGCERVGRGGGAAPRAGRDVRGAARLRRGEVRDVAAAQGEMEPGRPVERDSQPRDQHRRDRSRAVQLPGPEGDGEGRVHQDPGWTRAAHRRRDCLECIHARALSRWGATQTWSCTTPSIRAHSPMRPVIPRWITARTRGGTRRDGPVS
jgi:hypothetical protein